MRNVLRVSRVRFTRASPDERATGLLGFLVLHLDDAIEINGVTLRRTVDGDHVLSWPEKRDRLGLLHRYVRPLDRHAKRAIEEQVLAELVRQLEGTP